MNARFPHDPDEPIAEHAEPDPWGAQGKEGRERARRERLDELARLGMGLARRVARVAEATDAAADVADVADMLDTLSAAFGRVSRAVRLTEALARVMDAPESSVLAVGQTLPDGAVVVDAQSMLAAHTRVRGKVAKLLVRGFVVDAIEAEARERGDGFDTDGLIEAMDRMIGGPETLERFAAIPYREMAARICADLGVPFEGDGGIWQADDEGESHGPAPPHYSQSP